MDRFGAIILAAGLSRRMEDRNKMLLPINGKPMVRHVVETYLAAVDGGVTVVTGFEAGHIATALEGLSVNLVHNAEFEAGQPFSVRAGLLKADEARYLFIGLGDQPQLTTDNLHALMAGHLSADPQKISIPHQGTLRGNPIIVPFALREQLLIDQTNPGCGRFTRTYPELVQPIALNEQGFFHDIDTPAAYAAFEKMTSREGST